MTNPDVNGDAIVRLASDLISIPSVSTKETPAQEFVAAELARLGADVETWPLDYVALKRHPNYSAEFDRTEGLGVVGRIGRATPGTPTLMINGHVDVVPPGDDGAWMTQPFQPTVRDGRLYGRGACDTKGGLAAALHALDAIRDARIELDGQVVVSSAIGEEDGGSGTLGTLLNGAAADAVIVLEPTELSVVPAVAGALSFRIRLRGLSAHGAIREEGVSAIEKLAVVQHALLELEAERNRREADPLFQWLKQPFAICAGRVRGGDWPSSEADWLELEGRYGVAPDEDLDTARAEFEDAIAAAAADDQWLAEHAPTVEWWGGQFLPGRTALDSPIVTTLADAIGGNAVIRGMPYGCDMGLTARLGGMPTVVFGPGDIRAAHRPNEHVAIDDLVACAAALATTIVRWCGATS